MTTQSISSSATKNCGEIYICPANFASPHLPLARRLKFFNSCATRSSSSPKITDRAAAHDRAPPALPTCSLSRLHVSTAAAAPPPPPSLGSSLLPAHLVLRIGVPPFARSVRVRPDHVLRQREVPRRPALLPRGWGGGCGQALHRTPGARVFVSSSSATQQVVHPFSSLYSDLI